MQSGLKNFFPDIHKQYERLPQIIRKNHDTVALFAKNSYLSVTCLISVCPAAAWSALQPFGLTCDIIEHLIYLAG